MENDIFKNKDAQDQAVHLLQYLATGEEATPEHLLVFNKVLCGILVDEPVPEAVLMTDEEKETSNSLLFAVTQQWSQLKNTSIDGLRESFLKREGKLQLHETQWLLHVEQRGFDVLLDSIPWSYENVRLPWIDESIQTEWR